MEIKYSKQAKKYIEKLHKPIRLRIREHINKLPDVDNFTTCKEMDIRPLSGYTDKYRLRVGEYRVIFMPTGEVLMIEKIGPRGKIYKWL